MKKWEVISPIIFSSIGKEAKIYFCLSGFSEIWFFLFFRLWTDRNSIWKESGIQISDRTSYFAESTQTKIDFCFFFNWMENDWVDNFSFFRETKNVFYFQNGWKMIGLIISHFFMKQNFICKRIKYSLHLICYYVS